MTDRDIRSAFQHLKEDVMHNVQVEERLDKVTKPRTRIRPALVAFAGAAAVALVIGAAVLMTGGDPDPDPVPPATGSTTPPTSVTPTTVPPTTISRGTTPPAVTPVLDLSADTWVLHSIDGVTTSTSSGVIFGTTPQLGFVNLARDHRGGIAVTDASGLWWWQAGAIEPELVLDTPELQVIEVIPTADGPVARLQAGTELRYVDLATGADVDPIAGTADLSAGFPQQVRTAANGLTARIVQRIGDEGTADEPARLVIERSGEVLLDVVVAQPGYWARLHDFDGRRVIVSQGPFEPALPPETYLVIDLACAECTETFVATAGNASLTGPDADWTGDPVPFVIPTVPDGTSAPSFTLGTVVVADPALSPAAPAGGVIETAVLDGTTIAVDVDRAVGDAAGGLFVQLGNTIAWVRSDAPAINLFTGDDLYEDRVELRLEDVTVIDGEVHVVFIAAGGVEEQRYEEVWTYRVSTGAPTPIYRTGAYEGGIRRASLQNDVLVVTRHAEGFSWFEFFTGDGRPIDVANPYDAESAAGFPFTVDQAVLSPDGTTMAYLEYTNPGNPENGVGRVDLVVWDVTNGIEDRRTGIELGDWYPDRLDYDGSLLVLGRVRWNGSGWQPGAALRTVADGPSEPIGAAGLPSLVKYDLR